MQSWEAGVQDFAFLAGASAHGLGLCRPGQLLGSIPPMLRARLLESESPEWCSCYRFRTFEALHVR